MKTIRLFIFDLDGTLADTLDDIAASVNFTLSRLGRPPLPRDRVRQYVGDGLEALLMRALDGREEMLHDAMGIYTVHHSRNLVRRTRLYPGVAETLDFFRDVPMAVITNKTREFSVPLLERLGIVHYFKMIVGADDGLPLKPAPDSVFKVIHETGAKKDETVFVGDGLTDIKAGKAAGILTCAAAYGFRTLDELTTAAPDYIIHAFSELKDIFHP